MLNRIFHIIQRWIYTPEQYTRKKGVKIGKHCLINTRFWPTEAYLITVGDNVQITHNVSYPYILTEGGKS